MSAYAQTGHIGWPIAKMVSAGAPTDNLNFRNQRARKAAGASAGEPGAARVLKMLASHFPRVDGEKSIINTAMLGADTLIDGQHSTVRYAQHRVFNLFLRSRKIFSQRERNISITGRFEHVAAGPSLTTDWREFMYRSLLSVVVVGALLFATAVLAQNAPTKTGESAKGKVLTDAKGMTLYTFDKDAGSKSACNGPCANNWPPLIASADAKPAASYTVITRDDGAKQWAYKGKPLYTWQKDQKPGDITGDGFLNGAWHIAQP